MIDENEIPKTLEEVHGKLAELNVQHQNVKELLQDETAKYKRFAVVYKEINKLIGLGRKR